MRVFVCFFVFCCMSVYGMEKKRRQIVFSVRYRGKRITWVETREVASDNDDQRGGDDELASKKIKR